MSWQQRAREYRYLWHLAAGQIRVSWPRLVTAAIALTLAAAFITVAFLASALLRSAAIQVFSLDDAQANVIVRAPGNTITERDVAKVHAITSVGEASADLTGSLRIVTNAGTTTERYVMANTPPFARYMLIDGKVPTRTNEVALSATQVQTYRAPIGSELQVELPLATAVEPAISVTDNDGSAPRQCDADDCALVLRVKVVGVVASTPPLLGDYDRLVVSRAAVTTWAQAHAIPTAADRILALADDPAAAVDAINTELGASLQAQTTAQAASYSLHFVTAQSQVVSTVIASFAFLSLIVAAMVMTNTSFVLVHQRLRQIGLLRCIGAQRDQVRVMVLAETLAISVISGVLGMLLGHLVIAALIAYLANNPSLVPLHLHLPLRPGSAMITPPLLTVMIAGAAAWWPAKRATQITALQALSNHQMLPAAPPPRAIPAWKNAPITGWQPQVWRGAGLGLTVSGIAALALLATLHLWMPPGATIAFQTLIVLTLASAATLLVGVLMLTAKHITNAVLHVAQRLAARAGGALRAPLHLTAARMVRLPRRVGVTVITIIIATAMVTTLDIGARSIRSSALVKLDDIFAVDVQVNTMVELPAAKRERLVQQVGALGGIRDAVGADATTIRLETGDGNALALPVLFVEPLDIALISRDDTLTAALSAGKIVLGRDATVPAQLTAANALGVDGPLTVQLERSDAWFSAIAPAELATELVTDANLTQVLARTHRGQEATAVSNLQRMFATTQIAPDATVRGAAQLRAAIDDAMQILLTVTAGLLAVAMLIALLGVANTLTLSMLERTAEHRVLRMVGATQWQLRASLLAEGLVLAFAGTLIGLAIGIAAGLGCAQLIAMVLQVPAALTISPATIIVLLGAAMVAGAFPAFVIPAPSARSSLRSY